MSYASRKDDHIRLAVLQQVDRRPSPYDEVNFVHNALAATSSQEVSLATTIAGIDWPVPLFINAMTGGSERAHEVNYSLAIAARETGLPVASGSMSAYFADRSVADSYRVLRRENPDGIVIANLNANASIEMAERAVDLIEADALQIHVNVIQELVMPEGDRDFTHWPARIESLVDGLDVPVIVKEVGFGMSRTAIRRLADLGVRIVDVSGRGGTNFATIENARRGTTDLEYLDGWGQSAPTCLLDAAAVAAARNVTLLASGGVRHPLDVVRALALGARAVGASGIILGVLVERGPEALVTMLRAWLDEIRLLMVALGTPRVDDLAATDVLLGGSLMEFCRLRGIDPTVYALRSESPVGRDSLLSAGRTIDAL